jgi:acyl-CoA thioester hydrolase
MSIPAPLALYRTTIRPEWIDYNQHLNDAYYAVPFSWATDAFTDYIGLDADYRQRSGHTCYTAEGHLVYLRELKLGAEVCITTQLLGYDAKRMHLFHAMYHAVEDYLAATCEWMMIHVNSASGRGAPVPVAVQDKLAEIYAAHAVLPPPPQAGRCVSLQAKRVS